jgi:hypothetical protein
MLSQLGDAVTVNGNAALPERLMDWVEGLDPPAIPVNAKLDGLGASIGLSSTISVTGKTRGELEAPAFVIETVAWYVPAGREPGFTLIVRLAGVPEPELDTVSQEAPATDVVIVAG